MSTGAVVSSPVIVESGLISGELLGPGVSEM